LNRRTGLARRIGRPRQSDGRNASPETIPTPPRFSNSNERIRTYREQTVKQKPVRNRRIYDAVGGFSACRLPIDDAFEWRRGSDKPSLGPALAQASAIVAIGRRAPQFPCLSPSAPGASSRTCTTANLSA
jgi:hypothetical protein